MGPPRDYGDSSAVGIKAPSLKYKKLSSQISDLERLGAEIFHQVQQLRKEIAEKDNTLAVLKPNRA
jgi:hypothetical protein